MKVLSKIVWAIDLNSEHRFSIAKVQALIEQFGTDVILLHVLPGHIKGGKSEKKIVKSVEYELQNKFANKLSHFTRQHIQIVVEMGDVANQINKVAKRENANFILLNKAKTEVLGMNGFTTLRRMQKPVAVLAGNDSTIEKHIVCPVDFSAVSASALKSALLHARKINAKLSVISVFKTNSSTPRAHRVGINEEKEQERPLQLFKNEFEVFLKTFDFTNVSADFIVLEGNADDEIIRFSKNASLLYVGSGGKGPWQRAMRGSVSENVIRRVKCHVVVVRKEEVFKLNIPRGTYKLEKHFDQGKELHRLGYVQEAIGQFKKVLHIDELHLPSLKALSQLYRDLKNEKQSVYYNQLADTVRNQMNNRRIEEQVRKGYRMVYGR